MVIVHPKPAASPAHEGRHERAGMRGPISSGFRV